MDGNGPFADSRSRCATNKWKLSRPAFLFRGQETAGLLAELLQS